MQVPSSERGDCWWEVWWEEQVWLLNSLLDIFVDMGRRQVDIRLRFDRTVRAGDTRSDLGALLMKMVFKATVT